MKQWIGLAGLFVLIGGVAWAYLRHGTRIKSDDSRKTEDWPRITQGGSS
ncbi:hypothetical protein [Rhodopseudomonas pseudopalustris]|uniref:Uncharacterized protein n=1 Tax=Rhodopseudomonas pseudopalustris TaxID=1513892 RepID=A0A1H8LY20_9BRAD|nr:hypothetical protein [Rhodopseudomonas pseudopalustris]SEO09981.1 hypothetical protein SAMN05444123_101273 [Rhodopseudomonas pseudopalustris]